MPTLPVYKYIFKESNLDLGMQTMRGNTRLIAGTPVQIGNARQLLMDRYVVDDMQGCVRQVHQPVKRAEGPVIKAEAPYEDIGPTSFGTVMRDPETGHYRLWATLSDPTIMKEKRGHYYESEDGITWRRPELGLHDFAGSKANNIIVRNNTDNLCVLALPPRLRQRGRFAMLHHNPSGQPIDPHLHTSRNFLAFSDDGVHWTDAPENPVWYGRTDTNNCLVYNPERDLFMMYRRMTVNAGEVRRIGYSASEDLIHWTQPINLFGHDELDPLYLYGMPVSRYNGMYLGYLFRLHVHPRFQEGQMLPNGRDGKMDTELTWSRDGLRWERHALRPAFIPNSPPTPGSPDWGFAQGMANMIEDGDDVRIYYGGRAYLHGPASAAGEPKRRAICLATLKRDRFVSIHADEDGGYMLTKPLTYPGGTLHINGKTAPDGFIRVAVREGEGQRDGEWPKDWRFEQSVPFIGDSLDALMQWPNHPTLERFPSRIIRLHFWLEKADLFSFWFK